MCVMNINKLKLHSTGGATIQKGVSNNFIFRQRSPTHTDFENSGKDGVTAKHQNIKLLIYCA